MKTKLLVALLVLAGVTGAAQAANDGTGTVSFKGNITDTSCTVNGVVDKAFNMNVVLGNVKASDLSEVGKPSTKVPFSFFLTNCQGSAQSVTATFFPQGGQPATTEGYLPINTGSDAAKDVAIALYQGKGGADLLKIGTASVPFPISDTAKTATLDFQAAYVSLTGQAQAGTANAEATVLLTYSDTAL